MKEKYKLSGKRFDGERMVPNYSVLAMDVLNKLVNKRYKDEQKIKKSVHSQAYEMVNKFIHVYNRHGAYSHGVIKNGFDSLDDLGTAYVAVGLARELNIDTDKRNLIVSFEEKITNILQTLTEEPKRFSKKIAQ